MRLYARSFRPLQVKYVVNLRHGCRFQSLAGHLRLLTLIQLRALSKANRRDRVAPPTSGDSVPRPASSPF